MKKYAKFIAAISAAAMLTISSGMTAYAYNAGTDPDRKATSEKKGHQYYYSVVNYNTDDSRGYTWDTLIRQDNLPVFDKAFLDARSSFNFYAPTDKEGNKYGSGHIFGLLEKDVAKSERIASAKAYVDKFNLCENNLGIVMEYHNYSWEDVYHDEDPDHYLDYALRMYSDYYMNHDVLDKAYVGNISKNSDGSLTGYIYLDNYYISNLTASCSTNNMLFCNPELETKPDGIGFRTKIKFTVNNPYKNKYYVFGDASSISGTLNYTILKDLKFCYSCGKTKKTYTTNALKRTVKFDKKDCCEFNNEFDGIILNKEFVTILEGDDITNFKNGKYIAVSVNNKTLKLSIGYGLNIPSYSVGKNGVPNYYSADYMFQEFWIGHGNELKGCQWLYNKLSKMNTVIVDFAGSSNDYSCSASAFRSKL